MIVVYTEWLNHRIPNGWSPTNGVYYSTAESHNNFYKSNKKRG